MLLSLDSLVKQLPVIKLELHNDEISIITHNFLIVQFLKFLKSHFKHQFKILTCISGVDYPNSVFRFRVVYELLSLKYNARIRVKLLVDELTPVESIEKVFSGSSWWESEVWDMFGIFFEKQTNLVRLLTDYGFESYPLRKDFPLSGFLETRYDLIKNKVVYENLELAQEYRTFEFLSVWENYTTK